MHRGRRCSTAGRFLRYHRKVEGRQQPKEGRTRLHMRKGTNMDGQGSSTKLSSYRRKSLGNWRWEMGEREGGTLDGGGVQMVVCVHLPGCGRAWGGSAP